MKMRQVYVIEVRKASESSWWAPWEIHGSGEPCCEGGGLSFYRKRLAQARRNFKKLGYKFRLVRYLPEKS
jgi:hypothetical protein